uniref:Nuclease associated modular domain-containing protein n=1 Tax=Pseudo-nitzschia australis TaxID=44445 RepID=A0A7S4AB63_9STRA
MPSATFSAARMQRNRCFECYKKTNFQITMINLLMLSTIFYFVNLHNLSCNRYVGAFVFRERNSITRQRHDQQAAIYGHDGCNICRSRGNRDMIKGLNLCNNRPKKSLSSRDITLFESVVTDREQNQILSKDSSTPLTEVTSSQSKSSSATSQIEVVMTNNEKASVSSLNGVAVESSEKANAMTAHGKTALLGKMKKKSVEKDSADVPIPTANGGYSHTTASRAKISAANKGKTPWNKGKSRSPEVKARIAAGVRARNREVFLKKLEDMGITEEEFEAKKTEERRKKEAERRSRRTANGGYRPTEETKKKISRILKEKHAKGEVKRRAKLDPSKVRRGFTHSEETRKKISQSLRNRWQDDDQFQKKMKESFTNREDVRKKISESLKKKWQDPEFRSGMMDKMSKRKSGKDTTSYDKDHRKKISEAMKRKWQDSSYREKTLTSIKKSAQTRKVSLPRTKPKSSRSKPSGSKSSLVKAKSPGIEELKPMIAGDIPKRKTKKKRVARKRAPTKKAIKVDDDDNCGDDEVTVGTAVRKPKTQPDKVKGVTSSTKTPSTVNLGNDDGRPVEKEKKKNKKKEKDGSVTRLREERRDLFDLLYGDEDEMNGENGNVGKLLSDSSSDEADILFGDEDLDAFDPYGLDDY